MKNPTPDLLLRIAQGDAYGHGAEYIKFPCDQAIYDQVMKFERYVKHPSHSLLAGQYTDDGQMSIAVAELLIKEGQGLHWPGMLRDPRCWAKEFYEAFARDKRDGYSRGFQAILEASTSAEDMVARLRPDSDKNGAAMRSVPLGVISDFDEMMEVAEVQAKITHDTPAGILSSQAVALMSWYSLQTDIPLESDELYVAAAWEMPTIKHFFDTDWEGPVKTPNVGLNTVHAVATVIRKEKTLMGAMRQIIEWGGDTDSVAAIAWGIMSPRCQDEQLPAFLEGGLEDGTYGRDFLKKLGKNLMDTYKTT